MRTSNTQRRLVALASAALAAGALTVAVAPGAEAAPVFTDAETDLDPFTSAYAYAFAGTADCNFTTVGGAEPDVAVLENGPAVSASSSGTATYDNLSIPADTATASASATGTGKVTSVGGDLAAMDLTVAASAQLTNALGTSTECNRQIYSGVDLEFEFTVTHAGFLTLAVSNTGGGYSEAYVYKYDASAPNDGVPYVDSYGTGLKFNATTKVYLPAGTYRGYFEGKAYKYSTSSYSIAGTSTLHGEFEVAGAQTEAVAGKGKKYVALPAARSCATHTINAAVTGKKKRADQVKQITVFVNDAKVKKVKTPDKSDSLTVAVADDQVTEVVTEVKLFPRKPGKPGKVVEVGASYEACS